MSIKIGGIQKTSFIDYPNKIAATIFTLGCNFACGYCHNPELVKNGDGILYKENEILEFLTKRKGKLDAVVISGGEPTIQKDLPTFIKRIKEFGFLIKLDTNGTNPTMLQQLIKEKLIDYVAMDIKAPLDKYNEISKSSISTNLIKSSIDILLKKDVEYEFRTTATQEQLSNNDFEKIGLLLKGAEKYYIQKFVASKTLDSSFMNYKPHSDSDLQNFKMLLEKNIKKVEIR
ncbi:MAG: anaerobic ribonucleoside-triphosphate reductase activating protein [Candidatus Gastranaerophilales bacterium]|nr:anaerobic ribonucleoside-triphosphate reductase activating protein [Candidatus Gastranaerophilales bacterium]